MRKRTVLMLVGGMSLVCLASAVPLLAATVSKVDMAAEMKPLVFQFMPTTVGVQTLEAGRYPVVEILSLGDTTMRECLEGKSGQPLESFHVWQDLMDTGDIAIPAAYRAKGKVLITWTTRILGEDADLPYGEDACGFTGSQGTIKFVFTGGLAFTRLVNVADNNKVLKEITMSVPDGGGEIVDPTHTGVFTLNADMFPDKQLPAVIRLKVQWANETALRLTSVQGVAEEDKGTREIDGAMHNVIVTITRQ